MGEFRGMKEYCHFCHFPANFSDYEMVKEKRTVKDYETKEKKVIEYYAKKYIGQAVYIEKNGDFTCLPCAVMGRYDLTKKKTWTPKSELYP